MNAITTSVATKLVKLSKDIFSPEANNTITTVMTRCTSIRSNRDVKPLAV